MHQKTTAQLDADLAAQFAKSPAVQKRRLAADDKDKKDRTEDRETAGQEQGDADKDEGGDVDKNEAGGDYAEGDDDGDEKEKDKKDLAAKTAAGKKLAVGGDNPAGDSAGDVGAVEDEKQKTQKQVAEKSKKDAEDETPVGSPGSESGKGIGPMGDASNNVGYSQAVAECKRFTQAFGPQGGVWFAEGKTFGQAQDLFVADLKKENGELRKQNEQLAAKTGQKRGLSEPLNVGGQSSSASPEQDKAAQRLQQNLGNGLSRFAAGLQEQLGKPSRN